MTEPGPILIMQPLPTVATDYLLAQGAELLFAYEDEGWRSRAGEIRSLIYYSIPVRKPLLDALPALEFIGKRGAGVDTVDIEETTRRGIRITNVGGAGGNTQSVAEHAMALLMGATRLLLNRDAITRQGRFEERDSLPMTHEVADTRMGIVGAGNIGGLVGRMFAAAFNCQVAAYDPYVTPERLAELGFGRFATPKELFSWAQNVIVTAPLTPESRRMIGREELRALGGNGVLVIVSRGGIVDEDALADALRTGAIFAAGVDVYAGEPNPPSRTHPFFALDNIVLTPHVAGATQESRDRSSLTLCEQVWSLLNGGDAPIVDQGWLTRT